MPKYNINLLQNQEDIKYLTGEITGTNNETIHYPTDNAKDFYIQSLANMGQRVGLRTNGIKYNSIQIKDIFNLFDDSIIKIIYTQHISENNNEVYTAATVKSITIDENGEINEQSILQNELGDNIYNKYYLNYDEEFSIPVNNIEKYAKDSLIYNDGKNVIMCLYGKILGTDNNDENNVEIQYTKLDAKTGVINSAIRAFCLDKSSLTYMMLVLEHDDEVTNNASNEHEYYFKVYVTSMSDILNDINNDNSNQYNDPNFNIQQYIINCFSWNTCNGNLNVNPFNFKYLNLDVTHESFDEIIYKEYSNNDDFISNITGQERNTTIFSALYYFRKYKVQEFISKVKFNTKTDTHLSFLPNQPEEYVEGFRMQYNLLINDIYGLEGRLVAINNDIIYTYPNLLKIYSKNKYNDNNDLIFTQILYSLYENLLTYVEDKSLNDENHIALYLPGNYTIEYMYNPVDNKLYYTNDIFVTFTNFEDYYSSDNTFMETEIIKNLSVPLFTYDGNEKVMCLKFVIKYNDIYEDCIDTILYNEEYTLPYINSSNNWQINDKDSKISAVGKNAGNPNIIIVKSNDNGKTILLGSNYDIINSFEWIRKEYQIEENKIGIAYVPAINNANMQYIENSTLFNIYDDGNSLYSSIWSISENQYKYENNISVLHEFECVKDENGYAMNIDTLLGLEAAISSSIINNNLLRQNEFDYIVINSRTNTFINSDVEANDVIKCFIHGEINKNDTNTSIHDAVNSLSNDGNDTILKIEYDNKHTVDNNSYYITSENDIHEKLSIGKNVTYTHYVDYILNEQTTSSTSQSIISGSSNGIDSGVYNDDQYIVSSEISNVNDYTESTTHTESTTLYSYIPSSDPLNEYIPKINVPSIILNEMLLQDVNVINRSNIISFDENGNIYNAYIGTSFNENDKNTIHIGTSSHNINIGTDKLIAPGYNKLFNTHDTLSLDFDNINLNGNNICQNSFNIVKQNVNNVIYNSTSFILISKITDSKIVVQSDTNNIYSFSTGTSSSNINNIANIVQDSYDNDIILQNVSVGSSSSNDSGLILLNVLMKRYCNININDYSDINLYIEYYNKTENYQNIFNSSQNANSLVYFIINTNNTKYVYISISNTFDSIDTEIINYPIYITWYIDTNEATNENILSIKLNLKLAYIRNNKSFVNTDSNINIQAPFTREDPFLPYQTGSNNISHIINDNLNNDYYIVNNGASLTPSNGGNLDTLHP